MNINVSTLDTKHQAQWQELYQAYAEFYNMPMTSETLATVWSWIMDDKNPFYALVVKDEDDILLGFAHCRAMPSPLRGIMVGFLDDLYIKPECRGTGCVQALYAELQLLGKQQNWSFIRWITQDTNHKAQASYDKIATKTTWLTYQMDMNK